MTNLKKLSTAIATGAVLLSSVAPAYANTIEVSGNGAFSTNGVSSSNVNTTSVSQTNSADITNNVNSNSSTGGNSANFNTGGNTTVNTGAASSNTSISNAANVNQATVAGCGVCAGGTDVTISGNGSLSQNGVAVSNANTTTLGQTNAANIVNNVDASAKTGNNDAGFNTGGDTVIRTGKASTGVVVDTMANANVARIGGAGLGLNGGSSITISGNGAFSENGATLANTNAVTLGQANSASVVNDIEADAKSGGNDADFNTGGDVHITTGDASTDVEVSNMVNFNAADVNNCACVLGGTDIKIAGNGAYAETGVTAADVNYLVVSAANGASLLNEVDDNAKTGYNESGFNVGEVGSDPSITTGAASSSTEVSNSGNVNMFNQGATLPLPGDWSMSLHFDLLGLWGGLLHMVA